MVMCSAVRCNNRSDRKKTNSQRISFFRFPKDPKRRQEWAKNVSRKDWVPKDTSYLCIKHFKKEMINYTYASGPRLREGAIPTIFENLPKHLLTASRKRRKQPAKRSTSPQLAEESRVATEENKSVVENVNEITEEPSIRDNAASLPENLEAVAPEGKKDAGILEQIREEATIRNTAPQRAEQEKVAPEDSKDAVKNVNLGFVVITSTLSAEQPRILQLKKVESPDLLQLRRENSYLKKIIAKQKRKLCEKNKLIKNLRQQKSRKDRAILSLRKKYPMNPEVVFEITIHPEVKTC